MNGLCVFLFFWANLTQKYDGDDDLTRVIIGTIMPAMCLVHMCAVAPWTTKELDGDRS